MSDIKVGDIVAALGKPGIVIEILEGHVSRCFRLKSPDLIMRRQSFHDYSEIIDFGDHVRMSNPKELIAHANMYIDKMKDTIALLEQFKIEVQNETNR